MDSRGFWDESSEENEDDENQEPVSFLTFYISHLFLNAHLHK